MAIKWVILRIFIDIATICMVIAVWYYVSPVVAIGVVIGWCVGVWPVMREAFYRRRSIIRGK